MNKLYFIKKSFSRSEYILYVKVNQIVILKVINNLNAQKVAYLDLKIEIDYVKKFL